MITIQKTDNIVTDNATFQVADLPLDIQQTVAMLDDWREREVNAASELHMIRTAIATARDALLQGIIKYVADTTPPPAEVPQEEIPEVK